MRPQVTKTPLLVSFFLDSFLVVIIIVMSIQPVQPTLTDSSTPPGVVELPAPSLRPILPAVPHLYNRLPAHTLLGDGTPDYLQLILTSRCYEIIKETPITEATRLGDKLGVRVVLKREDLQPVFSFKIRGAYNLMAQLTKDEQWRGVVACSAGNHAQGVALSSQKLGIAATIVMPIATPTIKHSNVTALGAKVILHGDDFDASKLECKRLEQQHGLINIPPYDDPYVIAGQGTIAMELLRQINMTDLEAIFVCVGGGGILAGIASYIKRIAPPNVKVIGVEAVDQAALTLSLLKDSRQTLSQVGLFNDGTAVRIVGEETFRICHRYVDAMVLVNNDEVCAAIKDVFQDTRSVPEPSGALAVAGLKRYVQEKRLVGSGQRFVAVASGANMNFDRLKFVAERAALGEGKEVLLSVSIPETPGSFVRLQSYIHPRAVTEFSYRYSSPNRAHVLISFTLEESSSSIVSERQDEIDSIINAIRQDSGGMIPSDISDNEVAKSHVRYLVGGRKVVPHERLLSFAFPERPGALRKFLVGLGGGQNDNESFNISLFHYRGSGGDVSRVLAGIQVEPSLSERFQLFLANLGYPYTDETDNEVYRDFLSESSS